MAWSKEKIAEIEEKLKQLHISDDDLIEKFILGSGPGGQKINKSSSCVYLKHIPTGIEVKCQTSRSREENRLLARRSLIEKLEKQLFQEKTKKDQEREKIRRQKKRRSRKQKDKMLHAKKEHSFIKEFRKPPQEE